MAGVGSGPPPVCMRVRANCKVKFISLNVSHLTTSKSIQYTHPVGRRYFTVIYQNFFLIINLKLGMRWHSLGLYSTHLPRHTGQPWTGCVQGSSTAPSSSTVADRPQGHYCSSQVGLPHFIELAVKETIQPSFR